LAVTGPPVAEAGFAGAVPIALGAGGVVIGRRRRITYRSVSFEV
jgi:hypothetical protein